MQRYGRGDPRGCGVQLGQKIRGTTFKFTALRYCDPQRPPDCSAGPLEPPTPPPRQRAEGHMGGGEGWRREGDRGAVRGMVVSHPCGALGSQMGHCTPDAGRELSGAGEGRALGGQGGGGGGRRGGARLPLRCGKRAKRQGPGLPPLTHRRWPGRA